MSEPGCFADADNDLVDLKCAAIESVKQRSWRRRRSGRTQERFLHPIARRAARARLAAQKTRDRLRLGTSSRRDDKPFPRR
jgi:hypothetical protein